MRRLSSFLQRVRYFSRIPRKLLLALLFLLLFALLFSFQFLYLAGILLTLLFYPVMILLGSLAGVLGLNFLYQPMSAFYFSTLIPLLKDLPQIFHAAQLLQFFSSFSQPIAHAMQSILHPLQALLTRISETTSYSYMTLLSSGMYFFSILKKQCETGFKAIRENRITAFLSRPAIFLPLTFALLAACIELSPRTLAEKTMKLRQEFVHIELYVLYILGRNILIAAAAFRFLSLLRHPDKRAQRLAAWQAFFQKIKSKFRK